MEKQKTLTESLFTKMDTLGEVYFQVGDKLFNYACWRRGESEPMYVDHHDALVANGLSSWFS